MKVYSMLWNIEFLTKVLLYAKCVTCYVADKPPEVAIPAATNTPTSSQPSSRHMLLPHDTGSSSVTSSLSSLNPQQPPQQPERPNSRQEGYFLLEDCYSDNPPPVPPPAVSSGTQSALNKVPPAPPHPHLTGAITHSSSSHSIPDDAPPPPPKTGEPRANLFDSSQYGASQLYDSPPQQTYDNPKLNYINIDAHDTNDYKYSDSNDNVYKVPPPRVDTESLYKVPPVNHLKFVGGDTSSVYSVPPSSAQTYDPGVYDVPPVAKSVRDSNSSTDDSGIQSGEQSSMSHLSTKLKASQISGDDLYDQPPPGPKRVLSQDIYSHPPSSRSNKRLDIYDMPPPTRSRDLNDVVPVPRAGRKMSEGSLNPTGTAYINLQQQQRSPPSQYIAGSCTVPRKHPMAPARHLHPTLDDVYDFPRSSSLGGGDGRGLGHNDLDAMPPAPQPHGPPGGVNIHRYVNASSNVVHSTNSQRNSQELYMPMGAGSSSNEQLNYMPMGGAATSPSDQESYLPMGGRAAEQVGLRASTDSTYTVMAAADLSDDEQIMAPLPPPLLAKVKGKCWLIL